MIKGVSVPPQKEKVILGSFGNVLKKSREYQNIKLSEASNALYIQQSQLQALENENFNNLPQYNFTRGFAINYAQYLGLDSDSIATKFDKAYPKEKRKQTFSKVETVIDSSDNQKKGTISFNPLLLIVGVCVLGFAMFLMRVVSEAENKQSQPKNIEEVTAVNIIEQRAGASLENSSYTNKGTSNNSTGNN